MKRDDMTLPLAFPGELIVDNLSHRRNGPRQPPVIGMTYAQEVASTNGRGTGGSTFYWRDMR